MLKQCITLPIIARILQLPLALPGIFVERNRESMHWRDEGTVFDGT
jgi:hypothetical protein